MFFHDLAKISCMKFWPLWCIFPHYKNDSWYELFEKSQLINYILCKIFDQ